MSALRACLTCTHPAPPPPPPSPLLPTSSRQAVSTNLPATSAFGISADNVFGFWDWVGGRYSVCSAVGLLPLSLHFGSEVMARFLAGAHAMDAHFLDAPPLANLPVLLGLLGVWNSSFLGCGSRALLPYAQALLRFPAHIQQVDMESNGKRVTLEGEAVPFATGEVNFGEPGTNGQHSFYQLLHQGQVVPCDFIGLCESQEPMQLRECAWCCGGGGGTGGMWGGGAGRCALSASGINCKRHCLRTLGAVHTDFRVWTVL